MSELELAAAAAGMVAVGAATASYYNRRRQETKAVGVSDPQGISVRAITCFISLSAPHEEPGWKSTIVAAARFCADCAKRFEGAKYEVQTLRIVTNPFGEYLDCSSADSAVAGMRVIADILKSDDMPQGTRVRFAIGEARNAQELEVVPALIQAEADLANCCVNIPLGTCGLPDPALTHAAAVCCATLARETPRGEGNFNFTANFNMPAGCPYFPAACVSQTRRTRRTRPPPSSPASASVH